MHTLLAEIATFHIFIGKGKAQRGKWYIIFCFKGFRAQKTREEVTLQELQSSGDAEGLLLYMDKFISQKDINLLSEARKGGPECLCPITNSIMLFVSCAGSSREGPRAQFI